MLFNSFEFLFFLPVVFIIYWFLLKKSLKLQNLFIVLASYFFYGWWDWRFLSLIVFSSIVDYSTGILLSRNQSIKTRKAFLLVSILVNIGFLGFFKYYNFFIDSFVEAFSQFNISIQARTLNIILPVGISFYTFQTLSYTIDVYRRKLEPTKDILAFFAFVSFFPQLVAGPIERATNLLPQFYKKRKFDYILAKDGVRQILWGFFKKVVVADSAAVLVNEIFGSSDAMSGSMLVLGAFYFAFQIYGDFSGYSDIAIGTAKLFGFNLMQNFNYPYFSRDIAEFWRRWHISLSTWFRDYVYIPLGGSKCGVYKKIRNTFVIFIVSGFWHGANWTFIVWGFLNALYFMPLLLAKRNRSNIEIVAVNKELPSLKEFVNMLLTFGLTLFAWIFFRADNLQHAFEIIGTIFSKSIFDSIPVDYFVAIPFICILLLVEWLQRRKKHPLEIANFPLVFRWLIYLVFVQLVATCWGSDVDFIYFQF